MRYVAILCLALVMLVAAGPAIAHPHAWIDMRSRILLDDAGRVSGFELDWLFDEIYSAVILEDVKRADRRNPAVLNQEAARIMRNLKDHAYFSELQIDGAAAAFGTVAESAGSLDGARFRVRFTVPVAAPVDPRGRDVRLAVYDPSYYIEVVYVDATSATVDGPGAGACRIAVFEPNPSSAALNLAQSLDQNATAPASFGALFAQSAVLTCD